MKSRWKPSKEQLEAFKHFVRSIGESGYASPYDNNTKLLYSLLHDLEQLEKQGNKPQGKSTLEAVKDEKVENANKGKPKFEFDIDDWVVNGKGETAHITEVRSDSYGTLRYYIEWTNGNKSDPMPCFVDNDFHLWTIKDAKAGDVLDANGAPFIYKKHDKDYVYHYCGVDLEDEFKEANGNDTWNYNYRVHPATKAQRDLLFSKMHEAGYEWDEKKLELKKIASDNAEQGRLPFIWHDATKELPPKRSGFDVSEYVLVYDQFGSVNKSVYDYGNKCWMYNNYNVTHWAYLPEPPKTE